VAVTNTANKIYASFPIMKSEPDGEGNLIVYGKATDGSVDSDRQVIDTSWSAGALKKWMDSGANLRVQHQSRRDPAGKGLDLEVDRDGDGGHWLKALVVEPVAQKLVQHGILRAFSVGIANPVINRDMTGKAIGGIITGNDETEIFEVSLVDRPANKSCGFTLAKSEGGDDWGDVGDFDQLIFEAETAALAKAEDGASPDSEDDSTDTTPEDDDDKKDEDTEKAYQAARRAWKSVEPSLAKAAGPTEYLQARAAYQRWLAEGEAEGLVEGVYGTPAGRAQFAAKRQFDAGVGGGVDRDKLPASDFAGPNRTFPIVTPGDVSDAGSLIGHADNPAEVRSRIMSIAHRKGPEFVAAIPDAWTDANKAAKPKKGKKPAFDGAAKPFDGRDDDGDGQDADKPTSKSESVEKAGGKTCKGCGKVFHMDTKVKNCPKCGTKLPKGKAIKMSAADVVAKALEGHEATPEMIAALTATVEEALKAKKRGLPADTKPAGAHREPDGTSTVEQLEPQAGMSTDPDPVKDKVPASVKDAEPVSYSVKRMHDVFCAAYHEDDVRAEYPSLKGLGDAADLAHWTRELAKANAAGDATEIAELSFMVQAAQHLKGADPLAVADGRALLHKAFADMYPNTAKPTPTDMSPGRFQRPYMSAGRAPLTATGASPRVPPSTHTPEPEDFRRGLITTGHEADSPANKGQNNPNGYNARDYYGPAAREAAKNAMQAQHDRLVGSQPDLCPMAANRSVMPPDLSAGSVPTPATMPQTYAAPGEKSVDNGEVVTLLKALLTQTEKHNKKVTKALDAQLAEANDKITELSRQLDQLGSQPDPAQAPVRGVVRKSAIHDEIEAAPVERRSLVDEAQQQLEKERDQYAAYLQRLAKSGSPATRLRTEGALERLILEKAE
jgi:hypothetical protein